MTESVKERFHVPHRAVSAASCMLERNDEDYAEKLEQVRKHHGGKRRAGIHQHREQQDERRP